MSIIYDALKKVQKSKKAAHKDAGGLTSTGKDWKEVNPILVYLLVIAVGLFLGNALFALLTPRGIKNLKPLSAPATHKTQQGSSVPDDSSNKTTAASLKGLLRAQEGFYLNGVFFSGQTAYALVNNQVVQRGDFVDGALVRKVHLDSVELEVRGKIIILLNYDQ